VRPGSGRMWPMTETCIMGQAQHVLQKSPKRYRINPGETIVLVHFGPCALFLHFDTTVFTPPTYKNMQAAFYLRSRNLPKTVGVSGPSSAAKAGVAASPASLPTSSGDLSLIFLHPHTKTFYKLQVSGMALPTAPRFFLPCMPHLTLTPLTLT
jgi:hypothetical protein